MANRGTITYNGQTISTEDRDGSFAVYYDGVMKANIAAGHSQSLNCSGKIMKTDVVIGGKTLNCAKKKMASNITVSVVSLFPSEPSSYNLISSYTSSQTWTAPEDGYYQVEVFGASGKGGTGYWKAYFSNYGYRGSGGGGGGGAYCCSNKIKMNKGDTIILTIGAVGATTSATFNSSLGTYTTMQATSGGNGGNGSSGTGGTAGAGGTASGGNVSNKNGGAGTAGTGNSIATTAVSGGAGGAAGYTGGNAGGAGSNVAVDGTISTAGAGKKGFIKIYSGNTNNVITPVNYIQSTGQQYIDTLIQLSANSIPNLRVVADIELIKAAGVWCVSGSGVTFPIVHFGVNGNGIYSCGNGTTDLVFEDTYIQKRCIWDYDIKGETLTVDGVKRGDFVCDINGSGSRNFYISAYANGSGATCHSEKIYGYKFYSDGTLIRDFIPCTNASGIAGLYDRVEGKFYGNAGSGSFITG